MANQRKQGIERITLTIPNELLSRVELDAEARGLDRLALMREAVEFYLAHKPGKVPVAKKTRSQRHPPFERA
jgi:predicted DNA binding CopG/RHH family protein